MDIIFIFFNLYIRQFHRKPKRQKSVKNKKLSCKNKLENFEGKQLLFQIRVVIQRQFPDFFDDLEQMWDYRKNPDYQVSEIHFACIAMFLFKQKSRNAMNNCISKGLFKQNYFTIFGMKIPHLDTVAKFLEKSDPVYLENLKIKMVQKLINKKVFKKFLFNKHYPVAIDGTGIGSYDYEPWDGCPYKTYKNEKTVWQVPILEAKLVFYNGFSISLCTKWIVNTGNFIKQNCELKAFQELAKKIKKHFPRLPIVMLADGLYPNNTVFDICKNNNWQYIITLKEGNLKSLWHEIQWELDVAKLKPFENILLNKPKHKLKHLCCFVNGHQYKSHDISIVECIEQEIKPKKNENKRFVFITNIEANRKNIFSLCVFGRKRWNIENEGFDQQKNHGYALEHKFSRKNFGAQKNYYQAIQIAHLINQLVEKSKNFISQLSPKESLKSMWLSLIAYMMLGNIEPENVKNLITTNCQIRY